ncbi:MAG: hypothetical protein R6X16_17195 [Anaerolineae bacterium]
MSPAEARLAPYIAARAEIIAAYLQTWAYEILADAPPTHPALPPRLAYVDIYGGPSRRSAASRAVLATVASRAGDDPILRSELGLIANAPGPEDPDIAGALRSTLEPAVGMVHAPQVIGQHPWARIDARLDAIRPLATVASVDPAGYTGLGAGDAWRCLRRPLVELFLTLRYPLINMGASNTAVAGHLDAFWGERRAALLREELVGLGPQARQERIIAACVDRLRERGATHVLVFRLSDGHRCQELLLHATRELASYVRAKEILARHSSGHDQGVPDYAWDPVAARYDHGLGITRPLDALADELGRTLANQVVTAEEIHRRHHVGQPFVLQNYRDALELLAVHGRAYRLGNRMRILR